MESTDPLTKYWPQWLANCEESVRWLESGEVNAFRAERGMPPLTNEEINRRAEEYKVRAARYRQLIADKL